MGQYLTEIINISSFNANIVFAHFSIGPDSTEEQVAMSFIFQCLRDEIPKGNRANMGRIAADLAIEKIEFRYALYKAYAEEFFQDYADADFKALCYAVICDEYLTHANEPLQPSAEEEDQDLPIKFRNDGFEDSALVNACAMWEEACELESGGMPSDPDFFPMPESLFLAHIHALGNLRDIEYSFDDYATEDLMQFRDVDLPHLQSFVRPDTEIGQKLIAFLDIMTNRIENILSPPAPSANHLRLVLFDGPQNT